MCRLSSSLERVDVKIRAAAFSTPGVRLTFYDGRARNFDNSSVVSLCSISDGGRNITGACMQHVLRYRRRWMIVQVESYASLMPACQYARMSECLRWKEYC